jgi:DNA-binding transcriptional LysR family regulator
MNLDSLRVFCEVARQRSFSKAAEKLDVTQSAVSQTVQQVERELSAQLVDRRRRPLYLTPAGDRFFAAARDILDQFDRAVVEIRELENDVVGPITVASIYSVGLYHADAVARFMAAYPRATVRLQYLRPNVVVEAVLGGEATLGLMSYPKPTKDLDVVPWREEEMVFVCPPNHPLAGRKTIRLEEAAEHSVVGFDPDLEIRKRTDAAFRKRKLEPRVVLEFDNIETVKQAVQVGSGISFLPEETVKQAAATGTLAVAKLDPPDLRRPVGIIFRRGKPLSAAAVKFIETLTGRSFEATEHLGFEVEPLRAETAV